ncbi:MAG: hypothetical protein KGZ83_06855 [Sulfuricella sp.]|nr:hypothetical protein [Sulfuricella sp.]
MQTQRSITASPTCISNEFLALGEELEMLAREDAHLRKIAGAAALLIFRLEGKSSPGIPERPTALLARFVKEIPGDTLREALQSIKA